MRRGGGEGGIGRQGHRPKDRRWHESKKDSEIVNIYIYLFIIPFVRSLSR